jgi:hypothetical protein
MTGSVDALDRGKSDLELGAPYVVNGTRDCLVRVDAGGRQDSESHWSHCHHCSVQREITYASRSGAPLC